jgi:predicted amidohydrolase
MLRNERFSKIIFIVGIIFIVTIVTSITSCVGDGALIGRWRDRHSWTIEFNRNGKGILNDDENFTWKASNGRLTITINNKTSVSDYSIQGGSNLTIHGSSSSPFDRGSLWTKLGK